MPDTTGVKRGYKWDVDDDDDNHVVSQETIIKVELNPSSPFIALPKKLFKVISEKWMESFSEDEQPICSAERCIVFKSCD